VTVPAGARARPISDLLAGPNGRKIGLARQAGEREIQAGKVANVLIGIGAIFIAITRMMKGLVVNF
jgi:hypothetical protein